MAKTDNTVASDPHTYHPDKLFDITCVIGSVYTDVYSGGENPHTLAFKMIAEHGADGHFTFPNADGNTVHVTVETDKPKPVE